MLDGAAFSSGALRIMSYARPAKLFAANEHVMIGVEGTLTQAKLEQIVEAVVALLQSGIKS
jgi:hypothetical protein